MEEKLKALFDYQRFENEEKLASIIRETRGRRAARRLSDDEAGLVSAAGLPETGKKRKDLWTGKDDPD